MGPETCILARGLTKRYDTRDALRGIDLEVPAGICFGIFGPNGSGKTTLLKIISTLIQATAGELHVAGRCVRRQASAVRRRLGVLLDQPMFPRDFSLREGLQYTADLYQLKEAKDRIHDLVERMGLTWRVRDPIRTFSRGMAQRASLACALLPDPEILILDEPFTGLDREGCQIVEELIDEHKGRGRTVLLVTHAHDRGRRLADEVMVLDRGEIAFRGLAGAWSADDLLSVYK